MALAFRTALSQIMAALARTLRLKLQTRLTVANITALRAVTTVGASNTKTFRPGDPVYVTSVGEVYEWSPTTTTADNGSSVIRPTDVSASLPGRWLETTSTVSLGYLKAVNFWQGETKKTEFQARIYAARPSVAIVFESAENDPRSTVPGAVYDYTCRFSMWCIDENMRPDYEAFFGSGYTGETTAHPGAIAVMGDVKKALADENKRLEDKLDLDGGIKVIKLGQEDVEDADLAERVMVLSLGVEVIASVDNPDSDDEHQEMTSLYVQPQLGQLHAEDELDRDNVVVTGYRFAPQMGLTATPEDGTAIVDGTEVSTTAAAHTFGAGVDCYIDVDNTGALTFTEVSNDHDEPDQADGTLRVGRVVTDASGIVRFEYIAATLRDFGDAFRVIPEP